MSDLDEEMKTGEVHTDDDVVMVDVQQSLKDTDTAAAVGTGEASRCYPVIEYADHVGEQQQAATSPHIQSGCWRATRDTAHGASVLLTMHAHGEDTATVTAAAVYERLVQSHPHLVILYGIHDRVFVCEDGKRFSDFVARDKGYMSVLRVFYGVLLGLRFMHERGLTHGSVDAQHIVVGVNQKGKLLTRVPINGQQPESELLEGKPSGQDEIAQQQQQFRADEDAFVRCMKIEVERLLARLSETDNVNEICVQVLVEANTLLDAIITDRIRGNGGVSSAPRLHLRRAVEKLKKLADREAEACGIPAY